MDIFEFYCKRYNDLIIINENEIKKDKENKKEYKNGEITLITEDEELKSESRNSKKNSKKESIK